jgi:hypothetical protein
MHQTETFPKRKSLTVSAKEALIKRCKTARGIQLQKVNFMPTERTRKGAIVNFKKSLASIALLFGSVVASGAVSPQTALAGPSGCSNAHQHIGFTGSPSYQQITTTDWGSGAGGGLHMTVVISSTSTFWNYWGRC